jgi:hypothetical protein
MPYFGQVSGKCLVNHGNQKTGGESGIRTHVTLSSKHAFQACAFSHSAISPTPCEAIVLILAVLLTNRELRPSPSVSLGVRASERTDCCS